MMPDEDIKKRLIDLIDYVRHMAELGDKPVFSINEYKQLSYREADLVNRIGIQHDLNDEDGAIWLKIDRLNRIDPPPVPEILNKWLKVSRDPSKAPTINEVYTATISRSEADELAGIGSLDPEDIQDALRPVEGQDLCDVVYRLERLPDIKSAIDHYISGPWATWSQEEIPRRETIAIYDALFSVDQVIQTEGAEQPLEIVWGVGVTRWRTGGHFFDHPLIEQLVELHIDTVSGAISIRPRSTEPQIALKPYLALDNSGADLVLHFASSFLNNPTEDHEFSPYQAESFEPILRQAATQLDTAGTYLPDEITDITDRSVPNATDTLVVSDTWALYVRRRSDNFFIADLNKLKQAIEEADELPGPSERLVTEPSDTGGYLPTLIDIGSGSLGGFHTGEGGSTGGGRLSITNSSLEETRTTDFFFPKPFNDEQVSIIERLGKTDGIVVQGPPGTGKTHTIANIICHYLATGRRVLVTSKGEAALSVLRSHIPEGIRELVISLLTNEREGLKQLERAVALLASTATQIDPRSLEKDIHSRQQHILRLQNKIEKINTELQQWAEKHLKRVSSSPEQEGYLPMELAEKVVTGREQHAWFPDDIKPDSKPLFTDEDIASARNARKMVGADITYIDATLPSPNDLPDSAKIWAIHQDLVHAKALENDADENRVPMLSLTADNALERAATLLHSIEDVITLHKQLEQKPWLSQFYSIWQIKGKETDETRLFSDILPALESIASRRTRLIAYAVKLPDTALQDPETVQAIERAAAGTRPFGLLPFGKAAARELYDQIQLTGNQPSSREGWEKVWEYVVWRKDIQSFVARWVPLTTEYGFPNLTDDGDATGRWLERLDVNIRQIVTVIDEDAPLIRSELPVLFPYGLDAGEILQSADKTDAAIDAIKQNLSRLRLDASRGHITELLERISNLTGEVTENIRNFVTQSVGDPNHDLHTITDGWQELIQELNRVIGLRPQLETIIKVATSVRESGADKWSKVLLTEAVEGVDDPWTPSDWLKSWKWAQLNAYLQEIDGRERILELSSDLLRFDEELKKAFSEVVKLRTQLGLKKNITDRVASALTMFTNAIRGIGRGTGVRARRFRRNAKDAMERSYSAVPCWIMPTWRVSESLPAALGSFDLVIVDEASQSDITALPALIRARKVLIVGDDKQVSPTAAFIEERKILQLRHNYLQDQPFADVVLPGSSLYSLAQAMFPGDRILLREHFRCVEPIIQFSFQFYTEPLIPLRVPKPSERLDPPLIDIYVPHGHKDRRQINVPEAEIIVDEIQKLVNDPVYNNRTIGVVSLIGAKQAHHIQALLLERIGEATFLHHKIACGDSATFQGKERDIMFISMVDSPQSKSAKTSLVFQQRFNVALSRARDRQYLVRSVSEEMLKPEDLKAKVIRHFNSPMPERPQDISNLIELCDSEFERDVFRRLTNLEYHVTPQVRVGVYSIDMVVEGPEDKRLAIELDGDQYHGPERWADDLARQRVLERVGWRFWRCWGSSFTLDPEGCMDDLITTLEQMGINPMGAMANPVIYTEHRVVTLPDEGETSTEESAPQIAFAITEPDIVYTTTVAQDNVVATDTHTSAETEDTGTPDEELLVQPGDRILISYNDEPERQYTLHLSTQAHDPDNFVINTSKPLAQALMGYAEEDEVEIPAGGSTRSVTILKIDRNKPVPASILSA